MRQVVTAEKHSSGVTGSSNGVGLSVFIIKINAPSLDKQAPSILVSSTPCLSVCLSVARRPSSALDCLWINRMI